MAEGEEQMVSTTVWLVFFLFFSFHWKFNPLAFPVSHMASKALPPIASGGHWGNLGLLAAPTPPVLYISLDTSLCSQQSALALFDLQKSLAFDSVRLKPIPGKDQWWISKGDLLSERRPRNRGGPSHRGWGLLFWLDWNCSFKSGLGSIYTFTSAPAPPNQPQCTDLCSPAAFQRQ